ncbi:hypothetical protein AB0C21_14120 [Spirillospora sp. NPDC049024]
MRHALGGEVTQFLDGDYRKVPAWGDPRTFELLVPYGLRGFGYFDLHHTASQTRRVF